MNLKIKCLGILPIALLIFVLQSCKTNNDTNTTNYLSAPLANPVNLRELDGRKIVTTIQYQLLINLNLTLIELDKNANLVPLLAENFDVIDNDIIFTIRKGVKTVTGHEIKALDAELSLKRLILTTSASHSSLDKLICGTKIKTLKGSCEGLSSKEYTLKIKAVKKSFIPFILSLLASADNVIHPLTAIDLNNDKLPIVNFTETTGPYFIEGNAISDKPLNELTLKLNPNHFLSSNESPIEIRYKLKKKNELQEQDFTLKKEFNYINNIYTLPNKTLESLKKKDPSLQIFPTLALKNTMIFSTRIGREKHNKEDLIGFSLKIKKQLLNSKDNYPSITQEQLEYFGSGGDGQLSKVQLDSVQSLYASCENKNIRRKFKLGVFPALYEDYKKEFKDIKDVEVLKLSNFPGENNAERVDLFIATIDSSFSESLDLLQYNKKFGIFDVEPKELDQYLNEESKEVRVKILQKIHYKSLVKGYFVNIGAAPYYTLLNNQWKAEPPKLFVGFPVWKIKKKI